MKRKLRIAAGWLVGTILIILGFTRRAKKRAKNGEFILSVFFHDPNKKLFEYCVKWLVKNKFIFLSQGDMLNIYRKAQPFPANSVIITVDDGWLGNLDNIVATASLYQTPVTIFVSTEPMHNGAYWWSYIYAANAQKIATNNVEYYKQLSNDERLEEVQKIKNKITLNREAMTPDEVLQISKNEYITIGGHTVNHPILTKCSDEVAFNELNDSKILLEEWLHKPVNSFAYPNGSYDQREVELLKKLDYDIAYTTKEDYLTPEQLQNVFELPRFLVLDDISQHEALCRMLGIWKRFFK